MDIYFSLSYWLFLIQFWIILGILFTALEIIDGSLIFFLPIGLGSFLNALLLYLQEHEDFFDYHFKLLLPTIFKYDSLIDFNQLVSITSLQLNKAINILIDNYSDPDDYCSFLLDSQIYENAIWESIFCLESI